MGIKKGCGQRPETGPKAYVVEYMHNENAILKKPIAQALVYENNMYTYIFHEYIFCLLYSLNFQLYRYVFGAFKNNP